MSGTTGVRLRAAAEGSDVTTSGSVRDFSACSIIVTRSRRDDRSIGLEKTRRAWPPHRSQVKNVRYATVRQ